MNLPEDELTIEDIVDSFSARLERGERPSIEEYKRKHPQLADRIEAVLPALVVLENVDSDPGERKLAVDDSIPEVLGDYQIIQEIGRGGMGIVFEAQHTTMRRRVALKVLPKSSAEKPNYLNRFLTEARSAGQLHHTNIVPVFEVGQSDGLHYYSMQFIHGDNLDHVIDDIRKLRNESRDDGKLQTSGRRHHYQPKHHSARSRSIALEMVNARIEENGSSLNANGSIVESTATEPHNGQSSRTANRQRDSKTSVFTSPSGNTDHRARSQYHGRVAAVGVQVAEALWHAHEHGVLHRDVKPANLILDTDGNVWITDFGLAKLDTHDLTQTGDIIGTLRYMAPERFSGEADPRSDLYSLGLTLYELCTLQCAFKNDRGTQVADVASSSSVTNPRRIDETIPADLETIILKSIEPHPDRRYQTAHEMAEDLELFLADRPIRARRATWAEKCWRICRRNPIASSLAACLLVMLVVTTAGSIQFARSETANRKASQKSLFYSKLDQAKMRRFSGRLGQRFEAMKAIRTAVELLPEMEFSEDKVRETEFLLRSEVLAAMSLTDLNSTWKHKFEPGWGERSRAALDLTGNYFAVGSNEGAIRVCHLSDGKLVCELPGARGKDPPWVIKFSPNGKYLICRYHQPNVHTELLTVVWDLENGGRKCYVTKHTVDFSFSHDNRFVGISYHDRADIVRLDDGKIIKSVIPKFSETGSARRIIFNSDATAVAISQASKGLVEFWNIVREPILTDVVETKNNVYRMAWDSQRQIFVVGSHKGDLYYWLGSLDNEPISLTLHQNTIFQLHLHPQHELVATTAWDTTTRFTDLVAGREVLKIEDRALLLNGFCENGRLGLISDNGDFGAWDVALPMIQMFSNPAGLGNGFQCCTHPLHSNIVARTIGENIEFWDIENRKLLLRLYDVQVRKMQFTSTGKHFFVSGDGGLRRWSVSLEGGHLELTDETKLIERKTVGLSISKHDDSVLVGVGFRPLLVDSMTGELLQEFGTHEALRHVCLTADDQFALTGTWHGYGIKIWDTQTGEHLQSIHEDLESTLPLAHPTNPRSFYANRVGLAEYTIDKRENMGATGPAVLKRKLDYEGGIGFSASGKLMSVKKNAFSMTLLDAETHQEMANIVSSGQSRIVDSCFTADDETLVLACFDSLQVINLKELQTELQNLNLQW